jgi:hypothetical protein
MKLPASLKSEFAYSRKLFEAGLNATGAGGDSARNKALAPELARAARAAWVPAAVGVAVGALGVCLATKSKSGRGALAGGLLGGIVGFAGGVAWGSREATSVMARRAARNIGEVRDQRWLEKNPVAYA